MTTEKAHDLRFQLHASAVDRSTGIIRGATVAQANVEALGKFVFLDAQGKLTRDENKAAKKLPVYTDKEFLSTLMQGARDAGGVLKMRSDHDDSLGARAGFAENLQLSMDGLRVVADLHLNTSYRDREIVLETSEKTPQLIGLSIDFDPLFQIEGDRALMRCGALNAVDIVDEGAITHSGMFLKRGVDKSRKDETGEISEKLSSNSTMATDDKKDPTVADCMSAISALTATVTAMAAKMPTPVAAQPDAELNALKGQLSALSESVTTMKREKDALALSRGTGDAAKGGGSADTAAEAERVRLAAEASSKVVKPYLQLVAEKADTMKLKKSDAHVLVQRENPKAYESHLLSKGVITKVA